METYRRRIGGEEARDGYLLVEKRALSLFPPVGDDFDLGGEPVRLRAWPCSCRGPGHPHEHYAIDWPGLRRGQEVVITRVADGVYALG